MTERRNADEWTFTQHALSRAVDMAIDPEELREAIERPVRALPSTHYPGCHLIHTERLALAVNLIEKVVITVLWNTWNGRCVERFSRDDDLDRCRDA